MQISSVQIFPVRASKLPGFLQRRMGPIMQICGNSDLPFAMVPFLHQSIVNIISVQICTSQYGKLGEPKNVILISVPFAMVCTKALLTSKGSYGYGEPKNVILISVQISYFPVRASKLPGFLQRRMGPIMQICRNSGRGSPPSTGQKTTLSPWYRVCTKAL